MQYFEAFSTVMHSWWSAPLGNVRVLLVCFAGTAFYSLETWPVSELKVASGKPKRKHCSKRISQEQEEKENSKKSRPFKWMPPRRAPVFLLSPGINTRGTALPTMLNLLYVTWSGIDQSDIFRQWRPMWRNNGHARAIDRGLRLRNPAEWPSLINGRKQNKLILPLSLALLRCTMLHLVRVQYSVNLNML